MEPVSELDESHPNAAPRKPSHSKRHSTKHRKISEIPPSQIVEQDDPAAELQEQERMMQVAALYKLQQQKKLHPFDFNGEDLAEVKKMFPEFKPKRAVTRASAKVQGLPVVELKRKLKEKI